MTVDDLMSEISGLHAGDRVQLITELYKVYSEFHTEPFDQVLFLGRHAHGLRHDRQVPD